jgi:hypothetical protein
MSPRGRAARPPTSNRDRRGSGSPFPATTTSATTFGAGTVDIETVEPPELITYDRDQFPDVYREATA